MQVTEVINENVKSRIELDYYVPITVEYIQNYYPGNSIYYYRIMTEESSFIEFTIDGKSNRIYRITLVSINSIKLYSKEKIDFSQLPHCKGNPVINKDIWQNEEIITSKVNFLTFYNEENLYILPNNKESVTTVVCMPNVDLLLNNNNEIVGCIFNNLPHKNKIDFEEGIKKRII